MKYMLLNLILILSLAPSPPQSRPPGPQSQVPAAVPTVTFCELVNNQALYDKKVVRLNARYVAGFEVAAFENDPRCSPSPRLLLDVEFDGAYKECTDKKVLKELSRVLRRKKLGEVRQADLTVVGQFNGAKEGVRIGDFVSAPGYGHLGGHPYQFVIKCVERVQRVPKVSP